MRAKTFGEAHFAWTLQRTLRTCAGDCDLKLFCGIHEVVCRADGKLYLVYFFDEEHTLASIGNDTRYIADW